MGLPSALLARETGKKVPLRRFSPQQQTRRMHKLKLVHGHKAEIFCVTFDRTGRLLITGADDYMVKIWDVHNGLLLHSLRGHTGEITDLAVSHDNTVLASSALDNNIRLWELGNGTPRALLEGIIIKTMHL